MSIVITMLLGSWRGGGGGGGRERERERVSIQHNTVDTNLYISYSDIVNAGL